MPKIQNVSRETIRKPQTQASKDIKKINTNLKNIGVKFGTDSQTYKESVAQLKKTFGSNNVKVTKSGYFSVKNTKSTQSRTEDIEKTLSSYKMSVSGRKSHAKEVVKARGIKKKDDELTDYAEYLVKEERAIKYLTAQGKRITQGNINRRIEIDDAFDWAIENTGDWYEWTQSDADIEKTRKLLKSSKKSNSDMAVITRNILKMYREHLANKEHYKRQVEEFSNNGLTIQGNNNNIFSS